MKTKSEIIRNLIMEKLNDGEEYDTRELREYVMNVDSSLLDISNTLNSVLHHMCKSNCNIIRLGHGKYRMLIEKEDRLRIHFPKKNIVEGQYLYYINELNKISESLGKSLKALTYELSEEEYKENKKIYDLKKKLDKILCSV